MTTATPTVFLLSPAHCAGKRAGLLLTNARTIPLAARLGTTGATIGETFSFMSGLYFRGKLTYATVFGTPPPGWSGAMIIAPGQGLVAAGHQLRTADLRAMAAVPVDQQDARYREPLMRDARMLSAALGSRGRAVLLGSVATEKYVVPLLEALGDRLHFPTAFVGRGDMSRGGLLLRCARAGTQLDYRPARGAERRGARPPRLDASDREKLPAL